MRSFVLVALAVCSASLIGALFGLRFGRIGLR